MPGSQHRERVRPDLVRGVAVRRDPIGADEDHVDVASGHERPGGHVRDERVPHAGLLELPCRQPGALEVRPRLVDPDLERPLRRVGGLDDPERRPELPARQRAGVAVGQDPQRAIGLGQDRAARLGQPAMIVGRLGDDRHGLAEHRRGDALAVLRELADLVVRRHDPVDRPAQVDRRGPRVSQLAGRAFEDRAPGVGVGLRGDARGQREPDRRDLPDRGRAPHDHPPDGRRRVRAAPDGHLDELVGELALVDHEEDVVRLEPERGPEAGGWRGRIGLGSGRRRGGGLGPFGIQERRGLCRRAIPELGDRPDHLRRARHDLAGEAAEELPPGRVDLNVAGWRDRRRLLGHRSWPRHGSSGGASVNSGSRS